MEKSSKKHRIRSPTLIFFVLVSIIVAGILAAQGDVSNSKTYNSTSKEITIKNLSNDISKITLEKNTNWCYTECSAGGTAVLYSDGTLFDNFDTKDINGKLVAVDYNIYIDVEDTYQIDVPDTYKEICVENKTKTSCNNITTYKKENRTRIIKQEYKYEYLKAGNYNWYIYGTKDKSKSIDWAVGIRGISTDEIRKDWANWTTANCIATGGNITIIDGRYCVHTFLTNGTFNATGLNLNTTVLTVGGGGSRGSAGGGGGGGLQYNESFFVNTSVSVVVGLGGVNEVTNAIGNSGGNSSFGNITAYGGGGGGGQGTDLYAIRGPPLGSGGGGGTSDTTYDTGGVASVGWGSNGGANAVSRDAPYASGGGGGAGQVGESAPANDHSGNGGNGLAYNITGILTYYAGGGGGGQYDSAATTLGIGGLGGGGNGSSDTYYLFTNGTKNTGGGGGGGNAHNEHLGFGGSGIVIVRYDLEDITLPQVNIIYPANGTTSKNKVLNVNYTASDNININSCWYSNDSGKNNNTLTNCANITGVSWLEGINNVTIWASDTSGNENSSSISFTIDTASPIISIVSPTSTLSSLTFKVNISVTDFSPISFCSYNVTRGASVEIVTTSINLVNYTESAVVSGDASYVITIFCNDTVGNVNISSKSFTVSTSSPSTGSTISGGGGWISIEENQTRIDFCLPYEERFQQLALSPGTIIDKISENSSIISDYLICKSTSSIVPLPGIYAQS